MRPITENIDKVTTSSDQDQDRLMEEMEDLGQIVEDFRQEMEVAIEVETGAIRDSTVEAEIKVEEEAEIEIKEVTSMESTRIHIEEIIQQSITTRRIRGITMTEISK